MSRQTVFQNNNITVIAGVDHALGKFIQIFDKRIETEEGEGLVFDWSEFFGLEVNFTGLSKELPIETIIQQYIKEN